MKSEVLFRGDFYQDSYGMKCFVRTEYVFARSRAEALEKLEERKELAFYEIKVKKA